MAQSNTDLPTSGRLIQFLNARNDLGVYLSYYRTFLTCVHVSNGIFRPIAYVLSEMARHECQECQLSQLYICIARSAERSCVFFATGATGVTYL